MPRTLLDGSPAPSLTFVSGPRGPRLAYEPAVREAARRLVEGTAMSYAVVAVQVGVGKMAICRWSREGGWVRPPDAPPPSRTGPRRPGRKGVGVEKRRLASERLLSESERTPPRPPRSLRSAGQPYRADTVEAARRLVVGTALSYRAIARRIGITDMAIIAWTRRRGWTRPLNARTRQAPLAPDKLAAAKATARELVESTHLATANIAARVKVHPVTVNSWRRKEGWRWARREDREELRREFGKRRWRRESWGGCAPPRRVRRDGDGGSATSSGCRSAAPSPVPRIRAL